MDELSGINWEEAGNLGIVSVGAWKLILPKFMAKELVRRCKAYEGLVEASNNLSRWAAAIHWNRKKNTKDWMDGLRERIEKVEQALVEAKDA